MKKTRISIKKSFWLLLLVLLCCVSRASAQKIDYDELIENLNSLTNEQAFYRLFKYQSQNPTFANAYIQLGNVCENIFKDLDPLQDIELINYWASNAELYYQLFPAYLESGEVRRNRSYYTNIPVETSGKRLDNEDVLAYTKEQIEYCKNYKDTVLLIYSTFEKSKDHYNKCVRIFNEINQNYDNLNEVLLQTDDEFITTLDDLQFNFSACINEFKTYRSVLNKFSEKYENQEYILKKIETFRLDGLTNSNFLLDTFYLWDYDDWTKSFLDVYKDEIVGLRNEISSINKLFKNNTNLINQLDYIDHEMKLDVFDDLFLFRLGKYDNNSLIRELFTYLESRQKYLLLSKNILNNPADSTAELMNKKLRYYYRLAGDLNHAKTNLSDFNKAITPKKVIRFKEFFNTNYNGEEGLKKYYTEQIYFLRKNFSANLKNLKSYLENEQTLRQKYDYANYNNNQSIPLFAVDKSHENFNSLKYITRKIIYEEGKPTYIAGYIKNNDKQTSAYAAKISDNIDIEWITEFNNKTEDTNKTQNSEIITSYSNGLWAIISEKGLISEVDSLGIEQERELLTNILVHLDNAGEEISRINIGEDNKPFYLKYDEINQLSIFGLGKQDRYIPDAFTSISLSQIDSTNNINWNIDIKLKGQLVDIVRAENKHIAFFNFQHYDINGNSQITKQMGDNWSFVMLEISNDGEITKLTPIITEESIFISKVFSISSDEISLIGHSGYPDDIGEDLHFLIVSSDSEIIFSNIESSE
ncbi:MAG: hypothetical protein ACOCWC_01885 [Bacteroidota bacterium]